MICIQVFPKAFFVGYLGRKCGVNWNEMGVAKGRSLAQWQRKNNNFETIHFLNFATLN